MFLLGEMIQSIGLNLLLAMQWYISYNKAPFIYQGQEIGMTNYPFESIETFNDVAVKTEYQIVKSQGGDVNQLLDKI